MGGPFDGQGDAPERAEEGAATGQSEHSIKNAFRRGGKDDGASMADPSEEGAEEKDPEENGCGEQEGHEQPQRLLAGVDSDANGQDGTADYLQRPPLELPRGVIFIGDSCSFMGEVQWGLVLCAAGMNLTRIDNRLGINLCLELFVSGMGTRFKNSGRKKGCWRMPCNVEGGYQGTEVNAMRKMSVWVGAKPGMLLGEEDCGIVCGAKTLVLEEIVGVCIRLVAWGDASQPLGVVQVEEAVDCRGSFSPSWRSFRRLGW